MHLQLLKHVYYLPVLYLYSWLTCLLCIAGSSGAAGQSLTLVRQISQKPIVALSVDNYNRVITADVQGNITAYDTLGNALYSYSSTVVANVTLLEAWRSMQILVFYRDLQQYTLLDRFLTPLSGYPNPAPLPAGAVGFARTMTFAYDDQFWLFDDTNFSLKKYNAQLQKITVEVPLSLVLDAQEYHITWMREYQNQLFIADRNSGILVFDNLGNYRKTLPFKGLSHFQFAGEQIYFLEQNSLYFYNIYSQATQRISMPVEATFAIVVGARLFVYTKQGGYLYTLR